MDFQKLDVDYFASLVERKNRFLICFNDMGTGKTLEAIYMANYVRARRILVVCTKTLIPNWRSKISIWGKDVAVATSSQSTYKFDDWLENIDSRWFITNYDTFSNFSYLKAIISFKFDFVILDESHNIRNEKTERAKSVSIFLDLIQRYNEKYDAENTSLMNNTSDVLFGSKDLFPVSGKRAKHVMFLTGSPIMNKPTDIFIPLHYTNPDKYWSFKSFEREYVSYSGKYFTQPNSIKRSILSYGVQRDKSEMPGLPSRLNNKIPLVMNDYQGRIYKKLATELLVLLDNGATLTAPNVLALLIRLRQISLDPRLLGGKESGVKTDFLLEICKNFASENSPVVIFSTFETYITLLGALLSYNKIPFTRITGKESGEERFINAEKFQNGEYNIVLCTTKAASEGLDLFRSNQVFIADLWWTPMANEQAPMANEQAIGRLQRIGQTRTVTVHYLQNEQSIDERIGQIILEKMGMISDVEIESHTQNIILQSLLRDYRHEKYGEQHLVRCADWERWNSVSQSVRFGSTVIKDLMIVEGRCKVLG